MEIDTKPAVGRSIWTFEAGGKSARVEPRLGSASVGTRLRRLWLDIIALCIAGEEVFRYFIASTLVPLRCAIQLQAINRNVRPANVLAFRHPFREQIRGIIVWSLKSCIVTS